MGFQVIVFYSFAAFLILSAIMVISSKNSVRATLFLVLTFVCASVIWMLLEAEFLALSLIVVYVGAVMVLLLFVVMMLDIDYAALRQGFVKNLPFSLIIALAFFTLLYNFIINAQLDSNSFPIPAPKGADYSNIKELGRILYTEYILAFEIAAVILLVAIIAAIALTFRGRRSRKTQDITQQLSATRENRLKLVSMPAVQKKKSTDSNSQQSSASDEEPPS